MVLARELSLAEVAACRAALHSARIEYFIHGALCVSYSGQCYISEAITGRSANRGACAQLCRLPYDVYTESASRSPAAATCFRCATTTRPTISRP